MDLELVKLRELVETEVLAVQKETGVKFDYMVGTMIELPRAALTADEIAVHADFFSFGTNDLTQTTLGLSRDDAARFLGTYVSEGIFKADPFVTIVLEAGIWALKSSVPPFMTWKSVSPDIGPLKADATAQLIAYSPFEGAVKRTAP